MGTKASLQGGRKRPPDSNDGTPGICTFWWICHETILTPENVNLSVLQSSWSFQGREQCSSERTSWHSYCQLLPQHPCFRRKQMNWKAGKSAYDFWPQDTHVEVHHPKFGSIRKTGKWMESLQLLLMLERLYANWVYVLNESMMFFYRQKNSGAHLPI